MALADDATTLKLDGIIGFSGSVPHGLQVVRSPHLPGDREWLIYPLGSQIVVRQSGASSARAVLAFLEGHSNDVSCLCVSKDGRTLASGQTSFQGVSADVLVWNLVEACEAALAGEPASEKALVHRLRQHKGAVQAVGVNATDTLLATLGGRDDNALVIWDLETGANPARARDVSGRGSAAPPRGRDADGPRTTAFDERARARGLRGSAARARRG